MNFKHGFAPKSGKRKRIYGIWSRIKQKCTNPNYKSYGSFGSVGIDISDEWLEFGPFYDWAISNGYQDGLSLVRTDDTKGFSPTNCVWVNKDELKASESRHDIKQSITSLDGEVWKPIPGYEGIYEASNYGRIISLDRVVESVHQGKSIKRHIKGKLLSQGVDRGGYNFVVLQNHSKRTMLVHRIVAELFLPSCDGTLQVNHIDGNKQNNSVENLEYCTASENIRHAIDTGLNKSREPVVALDPNSEREVMRFNSVIEAQIYFKGEDGSNISNALNGRSKTAYGFVWRYGEKS